jgi:NADPH:quinone reductase-like Zn-dependent oxidoreductase
VGEPVHIVLDVLGGPAFADNLAVLAPRGRLIMLGFLAGSQSQTDLGPILRKRLEIIGTAMRVRGLEERIPLVREFGERMLPLFESPAEQKPLRPVLERTYPMTELADAHRVLEGNATFGKIVVVW